MIKKPKLNGDFAEFIGVLLGDGSIGRYECKAKDKIKVQHRVKITGDSQEDLPYFKSFLCPLMTKLFAREPLLRFKKNERTMDLMYFSKPLYNFLIKEIGMHPSPKRHNAIIPRFIFDKNLEKPFLRGLFDSDGCIVFDKQNKDIHYYPRLEVKMLPSPMREQILEVLKNLNFRYITSKQPNESLRIQINGKTMFRKWLKEVKFNNQKHITKYMVWEKLGYYITNTTIKERFDILQRG